MSMRGDDRRVSSLIAVQHVEVATTSGAENTSDVVGTVDDWSSAQFQWLVDAVFVSRS